MYKEISKSALVYLYMPIKTHATSLNNQDDKVLCNEQVNYCNRKKADSRMFYHLSLVAKI